MDHAPEKTRKPRSVAAQPILVSIAIAWLLLDPGAERLSSFVVMTATGSYESSAAWLAELHAMGWLRIAGLSVLSATALLSFAFETRRLLRRRRVVTTNRDEPAPAANTMSLRRMMFTMAMIAAWCAVLVQSDALIWQGKRWRSLSRLHPLDRLADTLHSDWPDMDGEIEGLGPFTAYPFGKPQVLLFLTPYPLDGADTVIAAVERSDQGVLRFQLGGPNDGEWIECHPESSRPESFTGGLTDTYELQRASLLKDRWYLVRYDS